ncbi:Major facilitator superfamily (MFS) profile [Nakaseomyces glabratus]|nr:Major facilitator superfamily (MFS) profile [Nakaseomyces glabratus]KAH7597385.1 Major facilitator superfamily (MFS) profile [Nakaseomyces glabratus]KAI8399777.1 Major facilitator superfamily (MFS) profile [Nakaseomyces glabratus]UCS19217.1 uncharacterized protein GW608_C01617 [Nakaseomyces glabratus]UCS24450.1 uncharacterized protein HLK63_C01617 [Nakaseomyces glabratus]
MTATESLMGNTRRKIELTSSLILAVLVSCLGTIQFGYHIAELNAPQQFLTCSEVKYPHGDPDIPYDETLFGRHGLVQCIPMTTEQFGVVTSVLSVGGLIGSYIAGQLAAKYGKKKISQGTAFVYFIGSLMLTMANGYWTMIFGRLLVGMASGISIVVIPVYINEITPAEYKGAMGTMNQLSINIGILFTQTIALIFTNSYYWRWILLIGTAIALVNFVAWSTVDESPKWLLKRGLTSEAEMVVYKLHGGTYQDAKDQIQTWQTDMNSHHEHADFAGREPTLWEFVTREEYKKPRNVIFMILCAQQFCGINSIIFYGVKVISNSLPNSAVLVNFGISVLNVLMTFVASVIIDSLGRKPLLLSSSALMAGTSFLISIGISKDVPILLVIAVFAYIASFAIGVGPIPLMIISELTTHEAAAKAQSFGTICNWLATFLVGFLFPSFHEVMGGAVYCIFSIVAIGFVIYIKYRVPETKNKTSYSDVWRGY